MIYEDGPFPCRMSNHHIPSSPHPDEHLTEHDAACYHMLWLKHSAHYGVDELERAFDQCCATTWAGDPFRCDEDELLDDVRRIYEFCHIKVEVGPNQRA